MVDFPAKVQLLLLAKADPDIEGPDVQTPLFDAAYGGSAWMCRFQIILFFFLNLWIIEINLLMQNGDAFRYVWFPWIVGLCLQLVSCLFGCHEVLMWSATITSCRTSGSGSMFGGAEVGTKRYNPELHMTTRQLKTYDAPKFLKAVVSTLGSAT